MAKHMPDAAVPLGSNKEVDTGPEHGKAPGQIEPRPSGKNRGSAPPAHPR